MRRLVSVLLLAAAVAPVRAQPDWTGTIGGSASFGVKITRCEFGGGTTVTFNVTRDDPCSNTATRTVNVSALFGTTFISPSGCVSGSGNTGATSLTYRNSGVVTVSVSWPSTLTNGNGRSLSFNGNWAVKTSDNGSYNTISGSSYSVNGGSVGTAGIRYFRLGGSISVPAITSDTQYGTYTGTLTVTSTCS